ncbi:MAG: TonB-dependent receptor, partial [Candidatus Competibacteraceae bacterium]|nr:TonB-dependent receptor [Candidatus Competibacteraceae bacterium]
QGDVYQGDAGQTLTFSTLTPPYTTTFAEQADFSGGNLQARWRHAFSATSELEAQIYYDRMERDEATNGQTQDTFDFDLQHRFAWSENQDIIWGLGYRFIQDRIRNSPYVGLIPDHRDLNLFSAFIHDEIKLQEQLFLTLGARFEHNDYTGFEIQPNARLAWTPDDRHTIWGAISRAVRTPSRADADLYNDLSVIPPNTPANPQPFPALVTVNGNPAILSESLIAYELGYRFNPHPRFSLDLAGFFNIYDNLRTVREDQPYFEVAPPSHLVLPLTFVNQMSGHTYGLELATDWRPLEKWRLRTAYTYFQANLRLDDGSIDVLSLSAAEGSSPRQQFSLFSTLDLSDRLEFDLWFRSVGALRDPPVDRYATLDARLGWKPYKDVELAIVGQNLLDSPHLEYGSAFTNSASTEVERGVYVRLDWRF